MTVHAAVGAPRRLWLVRHATPLIEPGVCYGALDVAADAQATRAAAERLAAALPPRACVQSSTLQRCEQLAQAVQGLQPDFIIKRDARLSEMNFGRWEGSSWDAIGPAALQAWTDDFADHAPGGGESVGAFMQRVGAVFDETRGALRAGQDAVWITHAGVIRATTLIAAGIRSIAQAEQWPKAAPSFGDWIVLTLPD
ncbi:MAG: histidine phosphatase family protein [Rhodoferax sp.]|nr:histidine phosphatase family protein [Rhodoferax sp.]